MRKQGTSLPDYLEIAHDLRAGITRLRKQFASASAWVILADKNTHRFCYPVLKDHLPPHEIIVVESGEANKNIGACIEIWTKLTLMGLDRNALLLNLGGGVIGDMGGFVASSYKRGISFVNLPTTLLSQVDASIGGKLGIDFMGYKNHIGLFRNPDKVIVHQPFLKTLPENELRSGYAEVIKHNLISDRDHWKVLTNSSAWKSNISEDLVRHSIQIKSDIVNEDPLEKGLRKVLNYGHTIGHAIETCYLGGDFALLHGEAVAAGMIIENFISNSKGMLASSEMNEANSYILNTFGKVRINENDFQRIVELARQDKKNSGKEIRATLIKEIGQAQWDITVTPEEVIVALEQYNAL